MKVTIEPSAQSFPAHAVAIDARTDDESTADEVALVLSALVAYGHDPLNVAEAAIGFGSQRVQQRVHPHGAPEDS